MVRVKNWWNLNCYVVANKFCIPNILLQLHTMSSSIVTASFICCCCLWFDQRFLWKRHLGSLTWCLCRGSKWSHTGSMCTFCWLVSCVLYYSRTDHTVIQNMTHEVSNPLSTKMANMQSLRHKHYFHFRWIKTCCIPYVNVSLTMVVGCFLAFFSCGV